MKNLILIRHSKSSWEIPIKDIDRPLSRRGIGDAHLISSKIIDYLPKSFVVWSSYAKRAKETAVILSQNLNIPLDTIVFKQDLYTFDAEDLEKEIKKCENNFDNLILFGHNDAITKFVNKFGNLFIKNVPTSGVVSLQFNTEDWKQLKKGKTLKTIFPSQFKNERQLNPEPIH